MVVVFGRECLVKADLLLVAGVSQHFAFKWEKRDDDGNTVPVDLSSWRCRCQIRSVRREVILDMALYVTLSAEGEITFDLPVEATRSLPPGSALWDLVLIDDTDTTIRFAMGDVTVRLLVSGEMV
jgi:hypothetical protein